MIFTFFESSRSYGNDEQDFVLPYSFNKEKIAEFANDENLFYSYFKDCSNSFSIYDFLRTLFHEDTVHSFSDFLRYLKSNGDSLPPNARSTFFSKALITEILSNSRDTLFTVPSTFHRTFSWRCEFKDPIKFYQDFFIFDLEKHKQNLDNGYVCFDFTSYHYSNYSNPSYQNCKFIFYAKRNLVSSSENKNIYSLISKNSYDNYLKDIIFPEIINQEETLSLKIKNFNSFRSYYNSNNFKDLPTFVNFDFVFNNNLLSQKLENHTSSRVDVIKVPSFASLSKDTLIEKTSYTKKQVLSRNTSFVPFLAEYKIFNKDFIQEDIQLLNFVSSYSLDNLYVKKRSATKFLEFINSLLQEDSLKIFNHDLYLQKIKAKYSSFFKYSSENLEKLTDAQKDELLSLEIKNSYTSFTKDLNAFVLSTPTVDKKLEKKFNKLKIKTESSLATLKSSNRIYRNVFDNLDQIKEMEQKIDSLKQSISQKKQELNSYSQQVSNSINSLFANYSLFTQMKEKYYEEYSNSTEYTVDEFLNNYSSKGVHLSEISFKDKQKDELVDNPDYLLNADSSKEVLKKFISLKKTSDLDIKYITFSTSSPTKINVVGKTNTYVYGGPYIVKVFKNALLIALKDKKSVFGFQKTCTFYVHPHSGSKSRLHQLYNLEHNKACLGEASPLLFKAFENNDIKLILLSAMTWVSSANSADTWGKNYIHFPRKLDLLDEDSDIISDQSQISESEVSDFLSNFSEEETSEDPQQTINFEDLATVVSPEEPEVEQIDQEEQPVQQEQETVYVRYTGNA